MPYVILLSLSKERAFWVLSHNVQFRQLGPDHWMVWSDPPGRYLRINRRGFDLLNCFSQPVGLEEVAIILEQQLGTAWNAERVARMVKRYFQGYGLFSHESPQGTFRQNPAYIQIGFTILGEELVGRIAEYLLWMFRYPVVVVTFLALIFLCYTGSTIDLVPRQGWFWELFLMGSSVLFHELGHAAALYRAGERPGRIGGGFYIGLPVMFTDVTRAWKLKLGDRLLVNIAGIYFECVYASLLFVLSIVLEVEAGRTAAVLIVIRTLWNLNPFLRSDGYWILADLTGEYSLRDSAWRELHRFQKGLFSESSVEARTPRENLLLIYAILHLASLLGVVIVLVHFLISDLPEIWGGFYASFRELLRTGRFSSGQLFRALFYGGVAAYLLYRVLCWVQAMFRFGGYFRKTMRQGSPGPSKGVDRKSRTE